MLCIYHTDISLGRVQHSNKQIRKLAKVCIPVAKDYVHGMHCPVVAQKEQHARCSVQYSARATRQGFKYGTLGMHQKDAKKIIT